MELRWIKKGEQISPGYEEGTLEIDWIPGIPMSALFGNPEAQKPKDKEERDWLYTESEKAIHMIELSLTTRKALFYDDFPGEIGVNCFNLFHFTVRQVPTTALEKYSLNLYVYSRSTNLKNLGYDLITIDQIYQKVFKRLNSSELVRNELGDYKKVELGKITFHMASLHYYHEKS